MFRAMLKFIKNIIKSIIDIKEATEDISSVVRVSNQAAQMIKNFEGYKEKAYADSVGVWTIGYGNTYYADGTPVKK